MNEPTLDSSSSERENVKKDDLIQSQDLNSLNNGDLECLLYSFHRGGGGGRSEHQRSNIMVGLLHNKEIDPELEPTMPVNINIKLSLSGDQLKIIHYVIRDLPLPTLAATKAILTFFATWITCS